MRMPRIACISVGLMMSLPLVAQVHERDPLNEKEVDQLRETAMEPEKRLKLMVDFTRERMTSLEQTRTDPNLGKDRGQKIHDLLQDITNLVDEIDDNVDDYNQRNADLRKPLKEIVQMDSEFQAKLHDLQTFADDPKNENQANDYKFAIQDAIESVNQSATTSRKLLDEQNVKFAKKKK